MKPDLILSLDGLWYSRSGDSWDVSADRPRVGAVSRILTDFDAAPAGVMTIDTKPDFAGAVIEKRLRSEGLVDTETHVLTHRVIPLGGGCRALYCAVPVADWQAMFAWLNHETSIGLVYSITAGMVALAQRHDAVVCRTGRQFRLLVSKPNTLIYVATTAFSDDPDDLDAALVNLIDQARAQWQGRGELVSVLWCDLLAADNDDVARLTKQVSQRLGASVAIAPVTRFTTKAGNMRTAADVMAQAVAWHAAVNPWPDRIAGAANQYRTRVAAVTAMIGVALFGVATFWATEALQSQARAAGLRADADAISRRNVGLDLPAERLLAPHFDTLRFLDGLAGAVKSPDPLGFMTDLRRAAGQNVRVMRVRMTSPEGIYRVDGVPVAGTSADRALSGFLSALRLAGYQVNAEDPGNQTQQPAFFSYSVRRASDVDGVKG